MKESTLVIDKDEATATPGSAAKLIREVKDAMLFLVETLPGSPTVFS